MGGNIYSVAQWTTKLTINTINTTKFQRFPGKNFHLNFFHEKCGLANIFQCKKLDGVALGPDYSHWKKRLTLLTRGQNIRTVNWQFSKSTSPWRMQRFGLGKGYLAKIANHLGPRQDQRFRPSACIPRHFRLEMFLKPGSFEKWCKEQAKTQFSLAGILGTICFTIARKCGMMVLYFLKTVFNI